MTGPTLQLDDVLIVIEGSARLTWCRTDSMLWRLVGMWPTPQQQAEVAAKLDRGAPLLVVLTDVATAVPLLVEEFADVPADLSVLAEFTGDVGELHVPFLNWLPVGLRDRGRQFLDHSEKLRKDLPRVLLPPLFVEQVGQDGLPVRFARWLRSGRPSLQELVDAATYLFSQGDQ